MDRKETEAWMLGYQEGYNTGYDEGHKKGLEEGNEKEVKRNKPTRHTKVDFLKIKCDCGCIIPYPVFKTKLLSEFTMPTEQIRKCPECGQVINELDFALAYTDYIGN